MFLSLYKSLEMYKNFISSQPLVTFLNPENEFSSVTAVFVPNDHHMSPLCALIRRVRRKRENPLHLTEIASEKSTTSTKVLLILLFI